MPSVAQLGLHPPNTRHTTHRAGKDRSLGYFESKEEAALTYDMQTVAHRGAGCAHKLNYPEHPAVKAALEKAAAPYFAAVVVGLPAGAPLALGFGAGATGVDEIGALQVAEVVDTGGVQAGVETHEMAGEVDGDAAGLLDQQLP